MTTLREKPKSKLGIRIQGFRADRPDEWQMDDYTRDAEAMQAEIDALKAENEKLKDDIEDLEYEIKEAYERSE